MLVPVVPVPLPVVPVVPVPPVPVPFVPVLPDPVVAPAVARRAGAARPVAPQIARRGAERGRRQALGSRLAEDRARAAQVGGGDADVGVRHQRLGDERIERRIVVELPPAVRQRLRRHRDRIARDEVTGRGGRGRRGVIVRPDDAAGERQQAGQRREAAKAAHHSAAIGAGVVGSAGGGAGFRTWTSGSFDVSQLAMT